MVGTEFEPGAFAKGGNSFLARNILAEGRGPTALRRCGGQADTAARVSPDRDETYPRLLFLREPKRASGTQLALKRAIDILVSGAGLLLLLPALLLIAALIRIESHGSPLFRQSRTGLNGVPFGILKFRSMYVDRGDPSGIAQTTSDDGRVTRVGRLLRRTNLDELPQLWNVFVGDMSLVGPRPHVPHMIAAGRPYEDLVIGYDHRHLMRPGLTGLAQSRGLRGPTVNQWKATRRIICDVEYIRTFSLALDARIVARTIANEIKGGTGS